ncbi:MAG: SurA N-terminal domain-containing protein [Thermodesulfobacteriota bacterium]
MLRILREHASSWMLRGILILVAVTFISWGGYSLIRERKVTYAAKVNGVEIPMKDYADAYQGMIKQYRDALGSSFSEKMIEDLGLRGKVLDDLISRVLILQEGTRLGLTIQDEELRRNIESIPSFQSSGQFDPRIYERFLRLNRMSAEQFEQMQRESLLISRVVNLVRLNGGKVLEHEILETYLFENERINLAFVKINPEAFQGQVTANEIEIKDYYEKHPEEFRTPHFLQVQYLVFRPSDYEGKVQIAPDEIERAYERRKERYTTPKRVKAREILIKIDPQDSPEKIEEKRKKAEETLAKAKTAKDFGALARKVSESSTASKGGDLGWIQRGMFGEPIESTLSSLKKGELSGVLRGNEGFYIFKIDEVLEEKQKPLEAVKDQILQELRREKARAEASRRAEDTFYTLFRSRDLDGYAKEKGVPIKTTGFFKEGEEIPEIGRNPLFHSSAISLKVGEISPVINVPPNFYILKLLDKKESRIPSLEEVKEELKRKVIGLKADEKARQMANDLLNQIRSGKSLGELAKQQGLRVEETGFFPRTQGVVPKIGPAGEFMGALSSLSQKHPVPKEVFKTKDGYFVVRLSTLEQADRNRFPEAKKNLERRLAYQKQEEFFQNWLGQLRAKAKIEINKELL